MVPTKTLGVPGVIVPPALAEQLPRVRVSGYWLPSIENIAEAERGILIYLQTLERKKIVGGNPQEELAGILHNFRVYRRQYVGIIVNGERRILCNYLALDPRTYRNWKTEYYPLIEGGPGCWRIEYIVASQQCTNFSATYGY